MIKVYPGKLSSRIAIYIQTGSIDSLVFLLICMWYRLRISPHLATLPIYYTFKLVGFLFFAPLRLSYSLLLFPLSPFTTVPFPCLSFSSVSSACSDVELWVYGLLLPAHLLARTFTCRDHVVGVYRADTGALLLV